MTAVRKEQMGLLVDGGADSNRNSSRSDGGSSSTCVIIFSICFVYMGLDKVNFLCDMTFRVRSYANTIPVLFFSN